MVRSSACLLVFLLATVSCLDEPDCYHLNNDVIGISFKKLENPGADTLDVTAIRTVEPPLLFFRRYNFDEVIPATELFRK